ncbi:cytochrome c [Sediminibacter sp. Hel_I_10]|uniref:c-type cytochrome n=1 Tax=Sediminibacter sp. Hel_I_10 TaxID=1392490 RepID=UPI00047EE9E8|nr:cytochrome c [Sediminibacter sp. Hel_I_10]
MRAAILLILPALLVLSCNSSEKRTDTIAMSSETETIIAQKDKLKESMERGAAIYMDFCMSCHLPDGKGVPKAYPPLANSDYLKNKQTESIKAIKYGKSGKIVVNSVTYNNMMASLGLTNKEVADVMNYINNSWGNSYGEMLTVEEVSKIEP